MRWKGMFALGVAAALSSAAAARAQFRPDGTPTATPIPVVQPDVISVPSIKTIAVSGQTVVSEGAVQSAQPPVITDAAPATVMPAEVSSAPAAGDDGPSYGPTPLTKVNILNGLLWGDRADNPPISVRGWMDFDYTYSSNGPGINGPGLPGVAPVMNRFGDEFLVRQLGLYVSKATTNELSWGFNVIFIGGSDASFLQPLAGGWPSPNPRFGSSFTDLNLTLHLPFLTEGGIDVKAGRQTTCLGPMGALPWQRPLDSSDYAWYNLEEGRYTGVSAVWHVNKQLDWYNGIEIGGWGVFFDNATHGVAYITQLNYWLDEEAKATKVWTTVFTGPTSMAPAPGLNTTVLELGLQHNYNERLYQILDTQMVWSRAPVFGPVPAGYNERAYDIYTYVGYHLNEKWDVTGRAEWYYDQGGGGYPGGFGVPNTTYWEFTLGTDFHPTKYLQLRPEIRYDHASNPNFGPNGTATSQFTFALEALFKF